MVTLATPAAPTATKPGSSPHDSGPSSVPFRGSSVPKARRTKPDPSPPGASAASYSTWLVLDADDRALPFLPTLHASPSTLATGSTPPAATTSTDKLAESTNIASSRVASAASNVRSQASKYENGLASAPAAPANGNEKDKDRRMSLPHQAGSGSTGRKGFMSRLRGTGGSVSSANVFNAPAPPAPPHTATPMSTSGSWSMVDPPTSKEPCAEQRTVHVAFTTVADDAAVKHGQGLVGRASPTLLTTQGSGGLAEELHAEQLDAAGLSSLISTTNAEAIYIGSARPASASDTLRMYLEELLMSANSSLRVILIEPAAVRHLTAPQASSLSDLARSRSITLLLPVRWASLWTASIEETLLGLEILHELHDDEADTARAEATTNGDPDTSVEQSFDVSMSHIPTGLSRDGLDKVAEVEAVKTQVGQLKRELESRDRRIAELSRLVEEGQRKIEQQQQQQQQQQREAVAEVESGRATAVVEPRTPVRSEGGAAPVQSRMVDGGVVATPSAVDAKSATQATSSPALPSASSTSRHLAAAVSSPSAPTSTAAAATLAPPAPITSPSPPVSPNSRSSTVIASLTAQLSETQALLDATRSALGSARTLAASHQAAADEMRSTLTRIRLEADGSVSILARKDRQIGEALERARKAEGDARELGRASREWGTRIREVEEELGKERMRRARAEHLHELVAGEWKSARTRLVDEVKVLKEEHRAAVDGLSGEYQKVLVFKDRLKAESELLTSDGEGVVAPSQLVKQLAALHAQMEAWIAAQLAPLSKRLAEFETRENAEVMDKLKLLTDELTRIKTLMRRGDVASKQHVPDGPF